MPKHVACDLDSCGVRYRRGDGLAEAVEGEVLGVDPNGKHLWLELAAEHAQQLADRAGVAWTAALGREQHDPHERLRRQVPI